MLDQFGYFAECVSARDAVIVFTLSSTLPSVHISDELRVVGLAPDPRLSLGRVHLSNEAGDVRLKELLAYRQRAPKSNEGQNDPRTFRRIQE